MFLDRFAAEKQRKIFIKNCIKNDTMRMASEILPGNCDTECDICYAQPDIPEHRFDIYKQAGTEVRDTAFFLIHGGAFVYGFKELDKNFGMNLAVFSGVPVVNVNYHLLPTKSLAGILKDLCEAVDYIAENRGIRKLHLIGDSAGGYLAVMMGCLLRSEDVRHDIGIVIESDIEVLSVNSICGVYDGDTGKFPGYFFNRPRSGADTEKEIPDYMFDLRGLIKRTGLPRVCLVTGDRDFLHDMNVGMRDFLKEQGIPVQFYDAISSETGRAEHVYAISDPAWQESHAALMLIIKNAVG